MLIRNIIGKLIVVFSALCLVSCAQTSNITQNVYNKETIAPENVRLIFNRKQTFLYMGIDARVEVNGTVVTKLANGSSFFYDVPAGRTNIKVYGFMDPGQFSLDLTLSKLKIYEFLIQPRAASFLPAVAFGLLGSAADAAINEKSGYFQISIRKIKDS